MATTHATLVYTGDQRQRILAHLDEMLECPAFASSPRRQAFLRYVVEETLAGRGAAIKERNLAADVFGRHDDFDAQSASVVRVTGGEVRKRLAQAYSSGLDDSGVRIELPLGGYQPIFHFVTEEVLPAPVTDALVAPQVGKPRWPRLLTAAGAIAAAAAAVVLLTRSLIPAPTATDLFWQPFLDPQKPVLMSLVSPNFLTVPGSHPPLKAGDSITFEEMRQTGAAYVGIGGALGAARFGEQLGRRGQPFQVKLGPDVAFADLKNHPTILIGPSRWGEDLTRSVRFRLVRGETVHILSDSQRTGVQWTVTRAPMPSQVQEGYALITRLMKSDSGYPVLIVVGMDPRDTQSGVEFVSNDAELAAFTSTLPADWATRSFQVVLHNSIHGNSPGSREVVASHVW